MKPDTKINYAFILTFIAGLLVGILLFSCKKENYDFSCKCHYLLIRVFDGCPQYIDLTLTDMVLKNTTIDMMHDYENSYQEHLTFEGAVYDVMKKDCHCLPTVCPKH